MPRRSCGCGPGPAPPRRRCRWRWTGRKRTSPPTSVGWSALTISSTGATGSLLALGDQRVAVLLLLAAGPAARSPRRSWPPRGPARRGATGSTWAPGRRRTPAEQATSARPPHPHPFCDQPFALPRVVAGHRTRRQPFCDQPFALPEGVAGQRDQKGELGGDGSGVRAGGHVAGVDRFEVPTGEVVPSELSRSLFQCGSGTPLMYQDEPLSARIIPWVLSASRMTRSGPW